MASVVYRFAAESKNQALKIPGNSFVTIFNIKKAIVKARRLDVGRRADFDLVVKNVETEETYNDETVMIERPVRLIVHRVPAPFKRGLLDRFDRNEVRRDARPCPWLDSVPAEFYNFQCRDIEEFIPTNSSCPKQPVMTTESEERKALLAVIPSAAIPLTTVATTRPNGNQTTSFRYDHSNKKPNADPELREKKPAKRVIGVPQTFRGLGDQGSIRANKAGFEELKKRTTDSFATALRVTGTEIPEYLKCGICFGLVERAVNLYWDPKGRTACESCICGALSRSLNCPLTGVEGIGPDELFLNHPIQRAVAAFVSGVEAKMALIQASHDVDDGAVEPTSEIKSDNPHGTEKETKAKKKRHEDDEFGGDVFAVVSEINDKSKAEQGRHEGKLRQPRQNVQSMRGNNTPRREQGEKHGNKTPRRGQGERLVRTWQGRPFNRKRMSEENNTMFHADDVVRKRPRYSPKVPFPFTPHQ
ncbi:Retinoblastoma binding protein 6 [Seminavis robusta]|uniref:Retinoblastoma binding protein 6 n=1 Tax=Seminavis robusta TaxID=568900 RepID=A0A9N8H258_9STRA|nr:Retinoblastoma binding protein 6 [Seminavis robusta]|eukprot:Sro4_g003350.1 Retinoblastoma binding protein 6 (474) ;mRNA; f:125643-127327